MASEISQVPLTDPRVMKERWALMKEAVKNGRPVPFFHQKCAKITRFYHKYPEGHWTDCPVSTHLHYREEPGKLIIRYDRSVVTTDWDFIEYLMSLPQRKMKEEVRKKCEYTKKNSAYYCFIRGVREGYIKKGAS